MKTGLFGGTFNPVHSGHVMIATDILSCFALDGIIIIPAASPPHKTAEFMADISLRLEMTRLAFNGQPGCTVSDIETRRVGRSYTIDTVNHFRKTLPAGTDLFFIAGLDAFLELDTWKDYLALMETIPFIVITRPVPDSPEKEALKTFLSLKISDRYTFSPDKACYEHETLRPVFLYERPAIHISSTEIRERLKQGRPIRGMVPDSVEQFIKKKGLYQ
ncbi:MAG: nicotinate-nucleotide adenylyltransferase [Thermodesulfobacteriota bacterium]